MRRDLPQISLIRCNMGVLFYIGTSHLSRWAPASRSRTAASGGPWVGLADAAVGLLAFTPAVPKKHMRAGLVRLEIAIMSVVVFVVIVLAQ